MGNFQQGRERVSAKICVIGPKKCGKSHFISQLCQHNGGGAQVAMITKVTLEMHELNIQLIELSQDTFLITPSLLQEDSAFYFLFDARDPDSLDKLKNYYDFVVNYVKNPHAIFQVIALRVSSRPSEQMRQLLNKVEEWAVDTKLRFYKLGDDSANQAKELITQHAQSICDKFVTNEEIRNDTKKLQKMGITIHFAQPNPHATGVN